MSDSNISSEQNSSSYAQPIKESSTGSNYIAFDVKELEKLLKEKED